MLSCVERELVEETDRLNLYFLSMILLYRTNVLKSRKEVEFNYLSSLIVRTETLRSYIGGVYRPTPSGVSTTTKR
jgi:hypothetical protein